MTGEPPVFTRGVRQNTAVVLALCGGSGSGKTKSALELAVGLAAGGKILIVDSEGARALHYADEYEFLHFDWRAPYTPSSLGDVLRAAVAERIAVVIVDSMSSEHEDEGGLVDMAEAEYKKQGAESKNSAAAWARPKAEHKHHIVRWLRTARCHVIFCCRASEKVRFEQVEDDHTGKKRTKIVPIGWTPIAEKNLLYDVTTSLLFTPDAPGKPTPIKLYEKHKPFFPADRQITREAGQQLAKWAAGGQQPPATAEVITGRQAMRYLGEQIAAADSKSALYALDPRLIADQQDPAWEELRRAHEPSYQKRVSQWHQAMDRFRDASAAS